MSTELFLGLHLPLNKRWQRRWIIRILRNRGATVEGNPEACADALVRSREFLLSICRHQLQDLRIVEMSMIGEAFWENPEEEKTLTQESKQEELVQEQFNHR